MDCCKHAINQLREAQNTRKETYSQFLTSIQEIQTLNRSLAEAEEDKEKIKEAATPILKLVSRLSENQASTPFLDQLREVPGLIRVYCKKAARVCTSRVLGTVRALALTLTPSPNGPNEIPHDPRHLGVPSGASKTISEPMVRFAQTMHLPYINTNTISKRTK